MSSQSHQIHHGAEILPKAVIEAWTQLIHLFEKCWDESWEAKHIVGESQDSNLSEDYWLHIAKRVEESKRPPQEKSS